MIIRHLSHLTKGRTNNDCIPGMQGTTLYEQRGNRTAPLIQLRLDNRSGCQLVWIGTEIVYLGYDQNGFQQITDTGSEFCRDIRVNRISAPFLRHQTKLTHFGNNAFTVRTGLVNFVDCNDNRYTCSLGMVNGLLGLRHYTVIGSDNDNNQIGNLGTPGTHCGKGLMSRCIQEGNPLSLYIYLIGTDMLGNTTKLAFCNMCLTDGIQ